MKGGKHIAPTDFAEHLKKSYVSESRKVYYGPFLQNGFHERYFYISEVDEKLNILKSLLSTHYCSRDEGGIGQLKILLESGLQCPFVYYVSALLRSSFISLSQFRIIFS